MTTQEKTREELLEDLHYAQEILSEIGAEFYGEVARYGDGWPGGRLRLWEIEEEVRLAREALRRHDAIVGKVTQQRREEESDELPF